MSNDLATREAVTPMWRRRPVQLAAFWLLLVAAMVAGTTFVRPGDEPVAEGEAILDPAAYAAEVYEPEVVPYITDNAVDLRELIAELEADPEATGDELGHRNGSSPYSFPVSLTGTVVEGAFGEVGIEVDGWPSDATVGVQTGPAVNGTALRDAVGFITFDQFVNQIEFANVASELNNIVKEEVLAGTDFGALQGTQVDVLGAFTYDDPSHIRVTPVAIEASDG